MPEPTRNQPISVHRSCWLGGSGASDHDGAHCDCDRMRGHAAIGTWSSSPHPNRCHRSNYRNIFSNLGRNAQRPASTFCPNGGRRTSGRYSCVSVPVNWRFEMYATSSSASTTIEDWTYFQQTDFTERRRWDAFLIFIQTNSLQRNYFQRVTILPLEHRTISTCHRRKPNGNRINSIQFRSNWGKYRPSPIFSSFSYFCIFLNNLFSFAADSFGWADVIRVQWNPIPSDANTIVNVQMPIAVAHTRLTV